MVTISPVSLASKPTKLKYLGMKGVEEFTRRSVPGDWKEGGVQNIPPGFLGACLEGGACGLTVTCSHAISGLIMCYNSAP